MNCQFGKTMPKWLVTGSISPDYTAQADFAGDLNLCDVTLNRWPS